MEKKNGCRTAPDLPEKNQKGLKVWTSNTKKMAQMRAKKQARLMAKIKEYLQREEKKAKRLPKPIGKISKRERSRGYKFGGNKK